MNSFESDLKRAIFSVPFLAGLVVELVILFSQGVDSDLFKVSVPVLAALPYSTAWLLDYQNGYIRVYVSRTGIAKYILGKILACGISGGLLEVAGVWLYSLISRTNEIKPELVFASAALWAVLSAVLAAWSDSRYIAYGGSFVIYYILVILNQRYFTSLYCLNPYEWLKPSHTWIFDTQGIVILLSGLIIILLFCYYKIVRRAIENV